MSLSEPILKVNQSEYSSTKQNKISESKNSSMRILEDQLNINQSFGCSVKYKYFNAFVLILSALCNSMIGVSFATINHQVTSYYGVSTTLVSLCALEFLFINPFTVIFANYILDNKGLKLGVSINCVLNIIGVSLRLFINQSFIFVLVGNAFSAMGNIFIVNCPARFSSVWFKPSQRIIITSLLAFSNGISGQIGAIISPYFVANDLTPQQGRNSVRNLVVFQAILISSVMLLNLILFRGIPNKKNKQNDSLNEKLIQAISISPSSSEQKMKTQNKAKSETYNNQTQDVLSQTSQNKRLGKKKVRHQRYFKQLKTLFTTKQYILTLISFSMIGSVLNSFATNIQLYILPFGFSSNDASNLTLLSVATGLFGAVLSSLIIKKIKKFKLVILIEIFFSIIFSSAFVLSLVFQSEIMLYVSVGFFTMLLYPLFPSICEYACQFMHPIRQSTIAGILVGIAQIISFMIGVIQTVILQQKTKKDAIICLIINVVCYIVAFSTMLFTKQKLKRLLSSNDRNRQIINSQKQQNSIKKNHQIDAIEQQ